MVTYEVERPEGRELGIRVSCPTHGESEVFQPGYRRVAFFCSGCGVELTVELDEEDPLAWDERC